MITQAMQVLQDLGIYPVFQAVAIAVAAIFLYRYFTDKG